MCPSHHITSRLGDHSEPGGQPQTYFYLKPLQFVPGKCFEAKMISSVKWELLVNRRH